MLFYHVERGSRCDNPNNQSGRISLAFFQLFSDICGLFWVGLSGTDKSISRCFIRFYFFLYSEVMLNYPSQSHYLEDYEGVERTNW